ncbi:hypothetical protein NKH77_00050 [Streptomyces sp. M19]
MQRAGDAEAGFLWQAAMTESLTANVTEFLADAGAAVLDGRGGAALGGAAAERAFSLMAEFTASGSHPHRGHIPGVGRAGRLRQRARTVPAQLVVRLGQRGHPTMSHVAGKVGAAPRPGFEGTGRSGVSCAGGWSNFVNPSSGSWAPPWRSPGSAPGTRCSASSPGKPVSSPRWPPYSTAGRRAPPAIRQSCAPPTCDWSHAPCRPRTTRRSARRCTPRERGRARRPLPAAGVRDAREGLRTALEGKAL